MNIKRLLSGAAAILFLSGVLTGCGASLKTARVASKFGNALKEQPPTSATAEINCSITTSTQGIPADTRFHTVVRSRADWDTNKMYSDVESTVTDRGKDTVHTIQVYSSGDSGEQIRYAHVDRYETWVRLEKQIGFQDIKPSSILDFLDQVSEDTTMEITEDTLGGGIHYLLKLSFTGDQLRTFAETVGIVIPREYQICDLENVTVPVEVEIEDKTFLPIRFQAKLQGIDESLIHALACSFAKGNEARSTDITMDEITLLITNFGYDVQDIPLLPKGAAENALDMKVVREIKNR